MKQRSSDQFNIPKNGKRDATERFHFAAEACMQEGQALRVKAGQYMFEDHGPDAGGARLVANRNIRILAEDDAEICTNALDNDFFRVVMPRHGVGLPRNGITVLWLGGRIDQSRQRNSTVVPYSDRYAPQNPGQSPTCDGISIRGEYLDKKGVMRSGIRVARVHRATLIAGQHWQSAGGDSGIFIGGCMKQIVTNCELIGHRDLCAYTSADSQGQLACESVVRGNKMINAFSGDSMKRGGRLHSSHNTYIGLQRAHGSDLIEGVGAPAEVIFENNTLKEVSTAGRYTGAKIVIARRNRHISPGAALEDGTPANIFRSKRYLAINCGLFRDEDR